MALATDFLSSNWINADFLNGGLIIEATIVSAGPHTFEQSGDVALTIRLDYEGKGLVLNQTRLKAMIAAFGPNTDNWVGKQIRLSQGDTVYGGQPDKCVVLEPILPNRIPAKPAAAPLAKPTVVARDGKAAANERRAPAPAAYDGPDDGSDIDDDIPY
jgi:hypothetical protein